MTFTVMDWIFAVIIIIFALIGLTKGFIENIFGKLSWLLAIICGTLFYDDAGTYVLSGIENPVLKNVVGFLMVFVFVFLVVKLVQVVVAKIFQWNILKSLDRTLGFFFGIIEGLVVVGIIIFIFIKQPFFPAGNIFNNSFFFNFINSLIFKAKDVSINV